jgi:hypothetical protein
MNKCLHLGIQSILLGKLSSSVVYFSGMYLICKWRNDCTFLALQCPKRVEAVF